MATNDVRCMRNEARYTNYQPQTVSMAIPLTFGRYYIEERKYLPNP
jgi:hypothetical protein